MFCWWKDFLQPNPLLTIWRIAKYKDELWCVLKNCLQICSQISLLVMKITTVAAAFSLNIKIICQPMVHLQLSSHIKKREKLTKVIYFDQMQRHLYWAQNKLLEALVAEQMRCAEIPLIVVLFWLIWGPLLSYSYQKEPFI